MAPTYSRANAAFHGRRPRGISVRSNAVLSRLRHNAVKIGGRDLNHRVERHRLALGPVGQLPLRRGARLVLVGGRGHEQHGPHEAWHLSTAQERAGRERVWPNRERSWLHKVGGYVGARAGQAAPVECTTHGHQQHVQALQPAGRLVAVPGGSGERMHLCVASTKKKSLRHLPGIWVHHMSAMGASYQHVLKRACSREPASGHFSHTRSAAN